MSEVKGHDMSRYWRLVNNEGGLITGTWWVTRPENGQQHVKPVDVVMWNEGRHAGVTLKFDDFTAWINDGEVEPIRARAFHDHVTREANARADEIAVAVLAAAGAVEWDNE